MNHEAEEKAKKPSLAERIRANGFFNTRMKILLICFGVSLAIYVVSRLWPDFAEFWTKYPAQGLRFVLAKATSWVPFSIAEALLIILPFAAIGYVVLSWVSTKRDESAANFNRWVRPAVSLILIILTIFFSAFGPAYGRYTLDRELGLERKPVSASELYETAVKVNEEIEKLLGSVEFDSGGASIPPCGYDELVEKIDAAYGAYAAEAGYISHFSSYPKPIALSAPMTYTHIAGVYTFMTGEANVNTNYPDFLRPFTIAHEMSHQRGVAREDEANFVAFLVCVGSEDEYIRYCGYANLLNYLMSALHTADGGLYRELYGKVPREMIGELAAYSSFFDEYRDSAASAVAQAVNDTFLHSQGQSAGTKSYGLVVDLAVAYYKDK